MISDLGKLVAAVIGAGLCLVVLAAWQLPTSGSPPGLDLRLIAVPPGELTIDPVGVVAAGQALQGGDVVQGEVQVRNVAGRRLLMRLAPLPSARDLARKVELRAVAGGRTIAAGTLASLLRSPGASLPLPARGSERIELSAWMAPGADGYRGRTLDVTLDFRAQPTKVGG